MINDNSDRINWKNYKKLIFIKSDYFRFSVNNMKYGRVGEKFRFEGMKATGGRFYWLRGIEAQSRGLIVGFAKKRFN